MLSLANRNFSPVFDDRTSFRARGLPPTLANRNFTPVFDDRNSFRAKGLPPTLANHNLTPVFDDRTSFRAKGWPFRGASSAPPAALREKRRRETVTEGEREREDVKMYNRPRQTPTIRRTLHSDALGKKEPARELML